MSKALISVRTDAELKERSQKLFADLGLDLSTAVNMFLRQSLVDDGIPFRVSRVSRVSHGANENTGKTARPDAGE
ncbi:MAG: type II toxin-antitoxin system RelB/DinJ family antitoxin [Bifidobacteriaceae bacterium]|jgi:DNA-damage-inducible protein J|nr:type II toxin-antitoxin system RelB/DinJ family antitoxin [Bifidobacteriaceae bacterium]MCI1914826.1 type II toxin-antitoxin system RelB/DinJ family antitoxin [Bifidobacteriaceae bacterium]